MSGVQVHSFDPISEAKAAKATAVTPQTAQAAVQSTPYQPATTTSGSIPSSYIPAQPGQTVPTATRTSNQPTNHGPPAPQPGAIPQPTPPETTAKATLPPPPKAGEVVQPPSYYAPSSKTTPSLPQPYPPQMSQPPLQTPATNGGGVPLHSMTSITSVPSLQPVKLPNTLPTAEDSSGGKVPSLEHPPGYVQNQFATDMTAEQRLANLEEERREGSSNSSEPVLGYVPSRSRSGSTNSAVTGGEIWEGAKKYLGQVGEKVSEVEGKTWDWINGKH